MWTHQNVIALAVAIASACLSIGMLYQKVSQIQVELAKMQTRLEDLAEALAESRTNQGRRLGRIEGWINGTEAIAEGRPPALQSARRDTRGIPVPLVGQESGEGENEGGRRG